MKTMRDILVVGSGGYIGSRYMEYLMQRGVDWMQGIDLNIYANCDGAVVKDVADLPAEFFRDKVVIYFAGFHREPDDMVDPVAWEQAYRDLMIRVPVRIASTCSHMIYISSMRAITDSGLYGRTKARAERALCRFSNTTCVRFGTIWGDLRADSFFPNRPNTAVNYALTRKQFKGDHWTAFTTHMHKAITFLYERTMELTDPNKTPAGVCYSGGTIENVVDINRPLVAREIRMLLHNSHKYAPLQRAFLRERCTLKDLTQDTDAAERLYIYHGLKWGKNA